jgi:hypothetical protein
VVNCLSIVGRRCLNIKREDKGFVLDMHMPWRDRAFANTSWLRSAVIRVLAIAGVIVVIALLNWVH